MAIQVQDSRMQKMTIYTGFKYLKIRVDRKRGDWKRVSQAKCARKETMLDYY